MTVSSSRRARGASVVAILVGIAIVVALAAAIWFLILSPHRKAVQSNAPAAKTTKTAAKKAAPPPANVAAMSTSELLSEASKAIHDQRLLAPKGNNAFEFYLKVLDRQPNNQVAKDALRETFPFAANSAEQSINAGDYTEANREIALLTKADPDNYTLTILRSKLDARRRVKEQQAEAKQLAAEKRAAAARTAAAEAEKQAKLDAIAKQAEAQQAAAEKAAQEKARQSQSQDVAQAGQQQQQQATKPEKVVIQDAVKVKGAKPRYPTAAARMRRNGWVLVQFTVGTDGRVHDPSVVSSQPRHVFDREALKAVSRWEYKPALRNGKPMAVTMRKRIVFKLGQ